MRYVLILFAFMPFAIRAQGWEQLPDFPGTPRDDAASFSFFGSICIGTGMDVGFNLTNDWFRYNTQGNYWTQIASLPASGRQYCSTFVINEIGYLFGGVDGNGPLNELWAYDPDLDVWEQKASLPATGRYASVGFSFNPFGFIATGMVDDAPTDEVWAYDALNDQWSGRNAFPGPPRHRAAGHGEFQMLIGGADSDFNALSDIWEYQPSNDAWSQFVDLPEARFGASAMSFAGGPMVIGGASSLTMFHDDVFTMSTYPTWTESSWTFDGGPRKGGIGGNGSIGNTGYVYYGLGVDSVQRFSDWYRTGIPLGMLEQESDFDFHLHPNPASDLITLQLSDQWNNSTVSIHDALGRTIKQIPLPMDRVIDVTDLAAGRYEIFVRSRDQRTLRAPLIKLE